MFLHSIPAPRLRSAGIAASGLALLLAVSVAQPKQASAGVLSFGVNETIENSGAIRFDLNQDGVDDFEVILLKQALEIPRETTELSKEKLEPPTEIREFAEIRAVFDEFPPEGIDIEEPREERPIPMRREIFVDPENAPFAKVFESGDTVIGALDFTGQTRSRAILYDGAIGGFGETGATGFVGLQLVDELERFFFGFAEITRGSITVGIVGFETEANVGALVPLGSVAVPVPPSLAFMAFGAFGLAAAGWRRRKQQG